MNTHRAVITWLTLVYLALVPVHGVSQTFSDAEKEKRWADQIIDTLFDGEVIWLSAEDHQFLAIEMASDEGPVKDAMIVVHGIGVHPNWEQVIRPIRVEMVESGWRTLSIQMPILRNEATAKEYEPLFDEVPERFAAAIEYLRSKGAERIVIVAHSLGAAMSSWYLAGDDSGDISALVIIGMNADAESMPVDTALALQRIKVPVLDLYGEEDLDAVVSTSAKRASAAHTGGNPDYLQVEIAGADHFFDGQEDLLLEQIEGWLSGSQ